MLSSDTVVEEDVSFPEISGEMTVWFFFPGLLVVVDCFGFVVKGFGLGDVDGLGVLIVVGFGFAEVFTVEAVVGLGLAVGFNVVVFVVVELGDSDNEFRTASEFVEFNLVTSATGCLVLVGSAVVNVVDVLSVDEAVEELDNTASYSSSGS